MSELDKDIEETMVSAEQIQAPVILTSSHELDDLRTRLERSRARGFIPKGDLSAEAILELAR